MSTFHIKYQKESKHETHYEHKNIYIYIMSLKLYFVFLEYLQLKLYHWIQYLANDDDTLQAMTKYPKMEYKTLNYDILTLRELQAGCSMVSHSDLYVHSIYIIINYHSCLFQLWSLLCYFRDVFVSLWRILSSVIFF